MMRMTSSSVSSVLTADDVDARHHDFVDARLFQVDDAADHLALRRLDGALLLLDLHQAKELVAFQHVLQRFGRAVQHAQQNAVGQRRNPGGRREKRPPAPRRAGDRRGPQRSGAAIMSSRDAASRSARTSRAAGSGHGERGPGVAPFVENEEERERHAGDYRQVARDVERSQEPMAVFEVGLQRFGARLPSGDERAQPRRGSARRRLLPRPSPAPAGPRRTSSRPRAVQLASTHCPLRAFFLWLLRRIRSAADRTASRARLASSRGREIRPFLVIAVLPFAPDSRRHADRQRVRRHVVVDDGAGARPRPFADGRPARRASCRCR